MIGVMNGYLVDALVDTEDDEVESAVGVTKIFDCINAVGNEILKGQCFGIEGSVGDAHAPDEVVDAGDMFLVWFWGEDNE